MYVHSTIPQKINPGYAPGHGVCITLVKNFVLRAHRKLCTIVEAKNKRNLSTHILFIHLI